ncbi:MAG: zinc-ribbon and DUF3426 domain-containing protein [Methylophilaceae bacterium]
MNYITSCPKCETQFVLNDDLIEAYQGDVQCGSCEHVFNAQNRLTGIDDDITSAEDYQASLEDTVTLEENDDNQDEEIILVAEEATELDDPIETKHTIGDLPSNAEITLNPEPTLDINKPSFIKDFSTEDIKPAKTKKHLVLFSMFSLLLLLTAALQTIYYMRVKIAAEYPQFKPLLMKACAQLQCEIGLPQNLDFITIGDSDMQEDDNYQSVINFSSSFKNTANYAQAYPSIELTLTNSAEKVVIKKLIRPEDYLTEDTKIESGIPGGEISAIKLPLHVHEDAVAGYRMLLVY